MNKDSKIFVAGHRGLVGSAIHRNLLKKGYANLLTKTKEELDLTDCTAVEDFFARERPEYVFLAAAKVGGIVANNIYRADFMYSNLMIQSNVIEQSYRYGVEKLLFMGSTCIYPKKCPQPIKESYLLTGELEYTNEPYAIAKIAGMKMCESYNLQYGTNFISVMPTNLYGPRDNFDLETSHVLPALVRKIHLGKALEQGQLDLIREDLNNRPIEGINGNYELVDILKTLAKYGITIDQSSTEKKVTVEIWGSGKPRREFLWSEDMADACTYLMEEVDFKDMIHNQASEVRNTHVNIGTGEDISIKEIAFLIKTKLEFKGELFFNTNKPDGTLRKVTDPAKLRSFGWRHSTSLEEGLDNLYQEYRRTAIGQLKAVGD